MGILAFHTIGIGLLQGPQVVSWVGAKTSKNWGEVSRYMIYRTSDSAIKVVTTQVKLVEISNYSDYAIKKNTTL